MGTELRGDTRGTADRGTGTPSDPYKLPRIVVHGHLPKAGRPSPPPTPSKDNNIFLRAIDAGLDAVGVRLGVSSNRVRKSLVKLERDAQAMEADRREKLAWVRQSLAEQVRYDDRVRRQQAQDLQHDAEMQAREEARATGRSLTANQLDPLRRVRVGQIDEALKEISQKGEDVAEFSAQQVLGGVAAKVAGVAIRGAAGLVVRRELGGLGLGVSGAAKTTLKRLMNANTIKRVPLPPHYLLPNNGYGAFQKAATGEAFEYFAKFRGGTLNIDGFANSSKAGMLDIIEAKFGNPFLTEFEKTRHVQFSVDKVKQLRRLAEYSRANSDFIDKVKVVVNTETLAQVYQQIAAEIPEQSLFDRIEVIVK